MESLAGKSVNKWLRASYPSIPILLESASIRLVVFSAVKVINWLTLQVFFVVLEDPSTIYIGQYRESSGDTIGITFKFL